MTMPLRSILEKIKKTSPGQSLAVFDLDSTLFDLTRRVRSIMHRFLTDPAVSVKFPEAARLVHALEIRQTDWGLIEPFARLGVKPATHAEFFKAAQDAWSGGFFSNEFLSHDVPLPGAVSFVESCLAEGAHVLYLTGRDVPRMGAGTEISLRHHGFPLDGKFAELRLKPDQTHDDAKFKVEAIAEISGRYQQIWLFENEPVNINAVLRRLPHVQTVLVETCHSGIEEVPQEAIVIENFVSHLTNEKG